MTLKEVAILTRVDGFTFDYYGTINGMKVVAFSSGGKSANLSIREVSEDKEGEFNDLIERNRAIFNSNGTLKRAGVGAENTDTGGNTKDATQTFFKFGD